MMIFCMHINFDKLELQINNHSVTKIIDFTALMLLNPDGIYLFKMQNGNQSNLRNLLKDNYQ